MTDRQSKMREEILEIPTAVDRLLTRGTAEIADAGAELRALDPRFAITVARGSSDHICTLLQYACEILMGLPVASVGPSVASIYDAPLKLQDSVCLAVSQSGKSPDIVKMVESAGRHGARCLAISNDAGSPLAQVSASMLDIHAGPELSVAATKTFVNSAVAGLMLIAEWARDEALRGALHALPGSLERATALDWPEVQAAIGMAPSLYTLGRGPVAAVSAEAALKFKETCLLHAESYSSAEVLHGPVSIVTEGFPVLCFAAADAAEATIAAIADEIAGKGARVFVTSGRAKRSERLDAVRTLHPLVDPLCLITSFYAMVERVARARGIDPDTPRHLQKVTETL